MSNNQVFNNLKSQISDLEKEIWKMKQKVVELKKQIPMESIENYSLKVVGGEVKLSELFNEKEDLIVIHNMGTKCPYCTMWADEINGVIHHIEDRASIVLISPDPPEVQRDFAESRGWRFTLVSAYSTKFIKDMGFESEDGKYSPGYSTFYKSSQGNIFRVSKDLFGPGDNYSSPWHFFRLLKDGVNNWQPKFKY